MTNNFPIVDVPTWTEKHFNRSFHSCSPRWDSSTRLWTSNRAMMLSSSPPSTENRQLFFHSKMERAPRGRMGPCSMSNKTFNERCHRNDSEDSRGISCHRRLLNGVCDWSVRGISVLPGEKNLLHCGSTLVVGRWWFFSIWERSISAKTKSTECF